MKVDEVARDLLQPGNLVEASDDLALLMLGFWGDVADRGDYFGPEGQRSSSVLKAAASSRANLRRWLWNHSGIPSA